MSIFGHTHPNQEAQPEPQHSPLADLCPFWDDPKGLTAFLNKKPSKRGVERKKVKKKDKQTGRWYEADAGYETLKISYVEKNHGSLLGGFVLGKGKY